MCGAILEVEFLPIYAKQKLFPDVNKLMSDAKMELFDIQRGYWKRRADGLFPHWRGQIVSGNALYLRCPEDVTSRFVNLPEKQLVAARIYALFRYPDLLVELSSRSDFPEVRESCKVLFEGLRLEAIPNTNFSFWRRKLYGLLNKIETAAGSLRQRVLSREHFAKGDKHLGNISF